MFAEDVGINETGDTSMPMGRSKVELTLSDAEQSQLASMARSRSIPAALVTQARIVLAAAAGEPNSDIAQRLQLARATVGKWCVRFLEQRVSGLYDEVRPGASLARPMMNGWPS